MRKEAYDSYNSANSAYKAIINSGASQEVIDIARETVEHRLKIYHLWCKRLQDDVDAAVKIARLKEQRNKLEEIAFWFA